MLPTLKNGDETIPSNYMHISLLSVFNSPGKKVSSSKKKTPLVPKKTATKKPLPKKAKESKASVKNQPTRKSVASKTRPLIQLPAPLGATK